MVGSAGTDAPLTVMKIALILESLVSAGGAYAQAIATILQIQRICAGTHEVVVYTTHMENLDALKGMKLTVIHRKFILADRLIGMLALNPIWHFLVLRKKIIGPFESALLDDGVDLAYFLTQSSSAACLTGLNFMTTVFDLAHRDHPEFPEVGNAGVFHDRERHFRNNLVRAITIVTASEKLSQSIAYRYGVDAERLLAMPFSVPDGLTATHPLDISTILQAYDLEAGYFFYPAQFWAHKNHIRILEAMLRLQNTGIRCRAVFAGGDQGNLVHIQAFITHHSLTDDVKILGFVPAEHLPGLYMGSCALLMPSYFGPTNLPPLEAWHFGKPVIYSNHLHDDAGDAAIYVNPDDADSLAEAMKQCLEPDNCEFLIAAGQDRLKALAQKREVAESALLKRLAAFAAKRQTWL
jgi:glycosyltransferase involved in cell wall biosynthesis